MNVLYYYLLFLFLFFCAQLPGLCGLYKQDNWYLTFMRDTRIVIGGKDRFGNVWALEPGNSYLSDVKRKPSFFICKTKTQISCSAAALLISAFVLLYR